MKTPTLLACAAFGLAGCSTIAAPSGPITMTSASKPPYGSYVVDGAGRALYVLEGTRGGPAANRCDAACLQVWPAFTAGGRQVAGGRLNQSMIRVVPGYSGTQVTYGGWPLYYYVRDQEQSDTTGQNVTDSWGTWRLLSPTGEPIRL